LGLPTKPSCAEPFILMPGSTGALPASGLDQPIEEFFALASGQPADVDATYEARIVSIERVGDAATAAIEEAGFWGRCHSPISSRCRASTASGRSL
jgi:hypothetical protein